MNRQRILKTLLAALAIAVFAYAGRPYLSELHRIADANLVGILGIVFFYVVSVWLQSGTVRLGLGAFGHTLTRRETFALFVVGSAVNLVLPRSGVGTSALYLNRVRRVPLADYGSVVLYNVALFVLAASLFGAAGMIVGATGGQFPVAWSFLAGMLVCAGAGSAAILIRWRLPDLTWVPGWHAVQKLLRATRRLGGSQAMWAMARIHLTLVLLRAARLYMAFFALGIEVHPLAVLLASALGDLFFIVAITPGALGFREAAIGLSATWLGTTTSVAVAVTLFDRLVFSVTLLVLSQFVWASVVRKANWSRETESKVSADQETLCEDDSVPTSETSVRSATVGSEVSEGVAV